jgi:hypothetical protein
METLLQLENTAMCNLQHVIKYAEDNNLVNSQEFINFLDEVNEISVKY